MTEILESRIKNDIEIILKYLLNEGRMCHYRDNSHNICPGLPIGLFLGQILMLNTEIIGEDI